MPSAPRSQTIVQLLPGGGAVLQDADSSYSGNSLMGIDLFLNFAAQAPAPARAHFTRACACVCPCAVCLCARVPVIPS